MIDLSPVENRLDSLLLRVQATCCLLFIGRVRLEQAAAETSRHILWKLRSLTGRKNNNMQIQYSDALLPLCYIFIEHCEAKGIHCFCIQSPLDL